MIFINNFTQKGYDNNLILAVWSTMTKLSVTILRSIVLCMLSHSICLCPATRYFCVWLWSPWVLDALWSHLHRTLQRMGYSLDRSWQHHHQMFPLHGGDVSAWHLQQHQREYLRYCLLHLKQSLGPCCFISSATASLSFLVDEASLVSQLSSASPTKKEKHVNPSRCTVTNVWSFWKTFIASWWLRPLF